MPSATQLLTAVYRQGSFDAVVVARLFVPCESHLEAPAQSGASPERCALREWNLALVRSPNPSPRLLLPSLRVLLMMTYLRALCACVHVHDACCFQDASPTGYQLCSSQTGFHQHLHVLLCSAHSVSNPGVRLHQPVRS